MGWERGTILLPRTAVPRLRRTLTDHANTLHAQTSSDAHALHDTFPDILVDAYAARLTALTLDPHLTPRLHTAVTVLHRSYRRALRHGRGAVAPPTKADIAHVAPPATLRTTQFPVLGGHGHTVATITLVDRTLTWEAHEVDYAHLAPRDTPTGKVLFDFLDQVQWTRGSGGRGTGNNEHNTVENGHPAAGENYTVFAYGATTSTAVPVLVP